MLQKNSQRLLATAVVCALVLAPMAPAFADTEPTTLQRRLDRLTGPDEFTGALAHSRDKRGRTRTVVSGSAERGTGKPMVGADARFRIGSVTKPIMAVTVMRLVEKGKVDLEESVDHYLPGVVRGRGDGAAIDGRKITVRRLLQQTSGLPDFFDAVDWSKIPQDYLDLALVRKPTPLGTWAYSNTNYLVAGMIVKAVTGQDFREVSHDLVIKPLGMRDTYWPASGETDIRGPHAHAYGVHPAAPENGIVDLTQLPGYELGPSGGLISTPKDLNRFWQGLFDGKVLSRHAVQTMIGKSAPITEPGWPAGARYGFGIAQARLSCGQAWFHGGDVLGVSTLSGSNRAGRQATVYITGLASTAKQLEHLTAAFDAALCDSSGDGAS